MRPPRLPRFSLLSQIIFVLVVVTLACGIVGYEQLSGLRPIPKDLQDAMKSPGGVGQFLDVFYLSCLLLWMGAKDTFGNHFIMVGRWTGGLVAFIAIVKLLTPKLETWVQRLRVRLLRDHTIVVGMTELGRSFLRDAASRRPAVCLTAAALDPDHLALPSAAHPVFLQIGDATNLEVLLRAGPERASKIIVVTADDVTNLAIARAIVRILEQGRGADRRVDVVVHVADPGLRREGLTGLRAPRLVHLRPFSVPALAARQLLSTWPFAVLARLMGAPRLHLVFLGFDEYAEELLLQTLRMGALIGQGPPAVTILAPAGAYTASRLAHNYPALRDLTALKVRAFDPELDITESEMIDVEGPHAELRVTGIVVTAATDNAAVVLARRARAQTDHAARWRAPIFVHVRNPAGFADVIRPLRRTKSLASALEPFGDIETLCSEAGLRDWHEHLAQRVHEDWYDLQKTRATGDAASPAEQAWNQLDEEYREANRRAVDHFPIKLASLGYIVRGDVPRLRHAPNLTADEIDALARLEHDSWVVEKRLAGWRAGARRDPVRKLHECLVPFDQLGEARRKDVTQILRLGELLTQDPARWLHPRGGDRTSHPPSVFRERTIGLVGHTVLSLESAHVIAAQVKAVLSDMDARTRLGGSGDELWTFVTPLAPGADLILARAISNELADNPRYRILIPHALSFESLAAAYLQGSPAPGSTPDGHSRLEDVLQRRPPRDDAITSIAGLLTGFVQNTAGCELVIDIPGAAASDRDRDRGDGAESDPRAAGFRATDAYLLQSCDELIAVLDVGRYGGGRPFSAAAWREGPADRFPAHGTAALVRAWLNRAADPRRAGALESLLPDGLRVLEP